MPPGRSADSANQVRSSGRPLRLADCTYLPRSAPSGSTVKRAPGSSIDAEGKRGLPMTCTGAPNVTGLNPSADQTS